MLNKIGEINSFDLLKNLKNIENKNSYKELINTIIIYGDEFFILDRVIYRIKNIFKNYCKVERVNLENIKFQSFIDNLNNISMFSSIRLILAGELNALKETDLNILLNYLNDINPSVYILFYSQKLDKRKKIYNEIFKKALVCNAIKFKDFEMPKWINGFLAEKGKKMTADAIEFLKLKFSNDLSQIEKEIEKISLYYQDKVLINRIDIEYLSSGFSNLSIFNLFSSFASKDKVKTLKILENLIKQGESPILINSMLMQRIKKMLLAKDLLLENIDDTSLAKELGIHKYYFNSFIVELKNFNKKELEQMYLKCFNTDLDLKSLATDKNYILFNNFLDLFKEV